jgi:hypothetical protein
MLVLGMLLGVVMGFVYYVVKPADYEKAAARVRSWFGS